MPQHRKMPNIHHFLSPSHAVRVTAPSSEGAKDAVHPYTRKQQFTAGRKICIDIFAYLCIIVYIET